MKQRRAGANGPCTGLHRELVRVLGLVQQRLDPGTPLVGLIENVVMSAPDIGTFTSSLQESGLEVTGPFLLDASHYVPYSRPRLWWFLGAVSIPPAIGQCQWRHGISQLTPSGIRRKTSQEVLLPGWVPVLVAQGAADESFMFPCFTTHQPGNPRFREQTSWGFRNATDVAKRRWRDDDASQSVYQYEDAALVCAPNGRKRRLTAWGQENIHGLPSDWISPVLDFENVAAIPEQIRELTSSPVPLSRISVERKRKSLIGNP